MIRVFPAGSRLQTYNPHRVRFRFDMAPARRSTSPKYQSERAMQGSEHAFLGSFAIVGLLSVRKNAV